MDIRSLRCFILTADLGSITRASTELGIVQSALSRKIQALEQELGASLFVRLPRGIQLTPSGRQFLDRARRIVREVEFAKTDVKDRPASVEGTVALGLSPTLAPLLAPDCLAHIAADFPAIRLKIVEGFSPALLDPLLTGRIDIAVLTNPPRTTVLQLHPVCSEEVVVVTPPGTRGIHSYFTLDELCNEPMVITSGFLTVIDSQLHRLGRHLRSVVEIDSVEAIRRMVIRGQATTLMPASTFQDDIRARRVEAFSIANANLHRLLVIAQPLAGRATPAIREVVSTLSLQFSTLEQQGVFRLPGPIRARRPRAKTAG